MDVTQKDIDELTYRIIGCAIEVHKELGPGLLESVYEKCFLTELQLQGLQATSQQPVPLEYKGVSLGVNLRYDVLVENLIVVELKSQEAILPIHKAVLLTYMKMLRVPKGIIINFNCTNIFQYGQKTMVNELYSGLLLK